MKRNDMDGLIKQFNAMCNVGRNCAGCPYEECETIVVCVAQFFADKLAELNSCAGCIHENGGEGSEVCAGCCRNYEEDCYEVESG